MLTGDNGIITNALKAKEETELAQKEENETIKELENRINDYTNDENEDENNAGEGGENPNPPIDPTDIYVTLYTDGTLGFSTSSEPIDGKSVSKTYGNIKDQKYTWTDGAGTNTPWSGDAQSITSVDIVDEIAPTDMTTWFCGLKNLTQINNMNNINTEKVTSMEGLFYGCINLTSLDVSGFNTENVLSMADMFGSYDETNQNMKLKTIKGVENFNTKNVINMSGMFEGCAELERIRKHKV